MYKCPCCGGDGKETCNNPDHGFIANMPGDIGRLGCPVCGHSPNHKVSNGGPCDICEGSGMVTAETFGVYALSYDYDDEPIEVNQSTTTLSGEQKGWEG